MKYDVQNVTVHSVHNKMFAKNHFGIFCFSNFHKYAKMVDEIFRNAKSAKISRLFSAAIIQIIPYNPCKIIQKKILFPFVLKKIGNFHRKYQSLSTQFRYCKTNFVLRKIFSICKIKVS